MSAEARLLELGVTLPAAPAAVGAYVPAVKQGNLVVTSGQLPMQNGAIVYAGKLGADLDIEAGQKAARLCALNALAQVRATLGSLDRVAKILRLDGYVQSAPGFQMQPKVLNGASEFLSEVFGEIGQHTRVAIGVSEMPLNAAVQLALWVEAHTPT